MKPEEIKATRKAKGMTQIDLAKACDVSVASIRLWEAGGNKQTPENLIKLKKALGVE